MLQFSKKEGCSGSRELKLVPSYEADCSSRSYCAAELMRSNGAHNKVELIYLLFWRRNLWQKLSLRVSWGFFSCNMMCATARHRDNTYETTGRQSKHRTTGPKGQNSFSKEWGEKFKNFARAILNDRCTSISLSGQRKLVRRIHISWISDRASQLFFVISRIIIMTVVIIIVFTAMDWLHLFGGLRWISGTAHEKRGRKKKKKKKKAEYQATQPNQVSRLCWLAICCCCHSAHSLACM